jgi:hypothetical protein
MLDATLMVDEDRCNQYALSESSVVTETDIDAEIQFELNRILGSASFRNSARCQEFLKYIVKFAQSPGTLKERTIGVVLFGRTPDYDTGTDAIVRVKANEVRRRLAQYNASADPSRRITIELRPGSYTPKILHHSLQPSLTEDFVSGKDVLIPQRKSQSWKINVALGIVLLAFAVFFMYREIVSSSPASKFWRPFLHSSQPIICISNPNAYNLTNEQILNVGDAQEAIQLKDLLQKAGRSSRIGVAEDVTSTDLLTYPLILLGGPRHNHWTATLTQNLRFAFDVVDSKPRIIDRNNPKRFWEKLASPEEDYVIVTRLLGSGSAHPVLCIAGIKALGSRIGTQLVFDPASLNQMLKYEPDNWNKKNLQLVLHVVSHEAGPSRFELLAISYW